MDSDLTLSAAEQRLAERTEGAMTALLVFSVVGSATASVGTAFVGSAAAPHLGGALVPILFGVQRFVMSSGLGPPAGAAHRAVANGLSWAMGEIEFIHASPGSAGAPRRRLEADDAPLNHTGTQTETLSAPGDAHEATGIPPLMASLLNLLTTCALAILLTIVVQLFLVCLWRHAINRRYYRQQQAIVPGTDPQALEAAMTRRLCCCFGPRRRLAMVKFFPFPKSLLWPSPLFFSCCIFVTGLTRSSVALLVSDPVGCSAGCKALPVVVLAILIMLVLLTATRLVVFRRRHGGSIPWKPAAKHPTPSAVGDPYMRMRAKARVHAVSAAIVAKDRASVIKLRRRSSARYQVEPMPTVPQECSTTRDDPSGRRVRIAPPEDTTKPAGRTRIAAPFVEQQPDPPPSPPNADITTVVLTPRSKALLEAIGDAFEEEDELETDRIGTDAQDDFGAAHFSIPNDMPIADPSNRRPGTAPAASGSGTQTEALSVPRGAPRPSTAARATPSHRQVRMRLDIPRPARSVRLDTKLVLHQPTPERIAEIMGWRSDSPPGSTEADEPAPQGLAAAAPSSLPAAQEDEHSQGDRLPASVGGTKMPIVAAPLSESTSTVDPADLPTNTTLPPPLDDDGMEGQPDEQRPDDVTGTTGRAKRRSTYAVARTSAVDILAKRGHRDRKSGAFGTPEADTKEPGRTERLLANPFALSRPRAGDSFQSLEGFLLFRVNGSNHVGACYRLLVIVVNMVFGILSGLHPLLPSGSPQAHAQGAVVIALQLGMSFLCFQCLPDADRIISRFAGFQFLCEGLATSALLGASYSKCACATYAAISNDTSSDMEMSEAETDRAAAEALVVRLHILGFVLSLVAMCVPMLQLLEQRAITPTINIVQKKGASPIALLAALYMLAASLPRQITNLIGKGEAGAMDAGGAADAASADAGDDAIVEQSASGGGGGGGGADDCFDGGDQGEGDVEQEPEAEGDALSGAAVAEAGARVSRLLARGLAAKEATGQRIASSTVAENSAEMPSIAEEEEDSLSALTGTNVMALVRLKRQQQARKMTEEDVDGDDAIDDGGAD
jgi:hypothetical protein